MYRIDDFVIRGRDLPDGELCSTGKTKLTSRAQANQNGETELSACILLKDFSDGD